MSYTRRRQEDYESRSDMDQQQHEQRQATIRAIDETKDNIHRAIDEVRRETPRYAQTITDFQNETADASVEIADNFLDSQKEVINSMQSVWNSMGQSRGGIGGRGGDNNYWTGGMMGGGGRMVPFFFSPEQVTNIYARTIGAMAEAYVASTRMATNMMFAGLEATRATTNYARQNAKEASRITSNTARAFGQTARETVQVRGEDQQHIEGEVGVGSSRSSFGAEGRVGEAETRTSHTIEGGTTTEKDRKK